MESNNEKDELTPRQQQVYVFIRSCCRTGVPPTVREIGSQFGITSPNGVLCHLTALEKKGWITRDAARSRSIRIVGDDPQRTLERIAEIVDYTHSSDGSRMFDDMKVIRDLALGRITVEESRE